MASSAHENFGRLSVVKSGEFPSWIQVLDDEDFQFLKRFLLASGSLKALAAEYRVSYPTVRTRLDRLMAKVKAADDPRPADAFEKTVRIMVADEKLSISVAKKLLKAHRASDGGK